MSDEGRLVAGRYRVIKRIGTGAMGAVWKARDDVLHRTVAVKQLMLQAGLDAHEAEDARQRTMREGRIAARLHHPNAITVFDVVTDENGQPCLIMEFLDSTSLAQVLKQQGTLPPLEVARIGAQVASAIREAHDVGIVHRDIKPGNILLADNGLVKITDFGISRAKDDVTVTKTGMIAGTPAYLAPEVAIGGDPGPESDVFSLGSTLYAAAEGQPPFGLSENTLSLLHAVAAGQINPPTQSGPLTSVLAVMLHPDVAHRPTVHQSEELLAAVARGQTPLGGPADEATRVQRGPQRGGTAVLGAAGAAAGGALGAAAHEGDGVPAGHSGNLDGAYDGDYDRDYGGDYGDGYDHAYEGGYDDRYDGHDAHYGDGYGDGYGDDYYDDYAADPRGDRGAPASRGPGSTRAVPAGMVPYDGAGRDRDHDDGYRDHDDGRYDDYDDGYGDDRDDYDDRRGAAVPPPRDAEDEPARGGWKAPAAVGVLVIVGMAAFFLWIFGSSSDGGDAEPQPGGSQDGLSSTSAPPTTTSSRETTTTTAPETSEPEPRPTDEIENPAPPPVQPTADPPEETSDPTSSSETSGASPTDGEDPGETPSEPTEPSEPTGPTDTATPDSSTATPSGDGSGG